MGTESTSAAIPFELTVGSKTFTQAEGNVIRLSFEDHVDMIAMLQAQISGSEQGTDWSFNVGDEVELKLGEDGESIFEGELVAANPSFQLQGISSINIRALDKIHRMTRGRKTRTFTDETDSGAVTTVADELGLSVDAESTDDTHAYILQRNESDLAFLKRLAARNNRLLRIEQGNLSFKQPQFEGDGYELKVGENLHSFQVQYNSMDQVQEVVVRGWSPADKAEVVGTATKDDVDKIGDGQLGLELAAGFGDSTAYITDVPISSQSAATAIAKAELNRLSRQYARGNGKVKGDPVVRAGTMVTSSGLPTGSNGSFFVLSTKHIISPKSGYVTEFTFCSNCHGT